VTHLYTTTMIHASSVLTCFNMLHKASKKISLHTDEGYDGLGVCYSLSRASTYSFVAVNVSVEYFRVGSPSLPHRHFLSGLQQPISQLDLVLSFLHPLVFCAFDASSQFRVTKDFKIYCAYRYVIP